MRLVEEEELLLVFFNFKSLLCNDFCSSSLFSGDGGWRGCDVDADAGETYSSLLLPFSLRLTLPLPPSPSAERSDVGTACSLEL